MKIHGIALKKPQVFYEVICADSLLNVEHPDNGRLRFETFSNILYYRDNINLLLRFREQNKRSFPVLLEEVEKRKSFYEERDDYTQWPEIERRIKALKQYGTNF